MYSSSMQPSSSLMGQHPPPSSAGMIIGGGSTTSSGSSGLMHQQHQQLQQQQQQQQQQQKNDVFVGNLAFNTTEEQLYQIFSEIGRVVKVRMVSDLDTGKPRGFAFVEFEDPQAALAAIRNMNEYELNGRPLRVNFSNSSHLESLASKLGMDMSSSSAATSSTAQLLQQQQQQQPRKGEAGIAVIEAAAGTTAIADALRGLNKAEIYDILSQFKSIADKDPDEARKLLCAHPQLPEAVLFLMSKLDMIQTPLASSEFGMAAGVTTLPTIGTQQPPPPLPASGAQVSMLQQQQQQPPPPQVVADPRLRAAAAPPTDPRMVAATASMAPPTMVDPRTAALRSADPRMAAAAAMDPRTAAAAAAAAYAPVQPPPMPPQHLSGTTATTSAPTATMNLPPPPTTTTATMASAMVPPPPMLQPQQQQQQQPMGGLDPSFIQQVLSLTPQQIAQLPPDKQQSILALRHQLMGGR